MEPQRLFLKLPAVRDEVLKPIKNSKDFQRVCVPNVPHTAQLMDEILKSLDCKTFFSKTIPCFQELVSQRNTLFEGGQVQLLCKDETVTISKKGAACLIGMAFFSAFDGLERKARGEFNTFTFLFLWGHALAAPLTCLLHYMNRVSDKSMTDTPIVLKRFVLPEDLVLDKTKPICDVMVTWDTPIEATDCQLHADFANKYPGGGTLEGGNVQEEILFMIKPECLLSMLLVQKLEKNEAFSIEGAEQFCKYSGYGHRWRFNGDHRDKREPAAVIGVDASVNRAGGDEQFDDSCVKRDIQKMVAGLFHYTGKDLRYATGNWGCGAFGGDKHLKAFQQIVAASYLEIPLTYCTFNEKPLAEEIETFLSVFKGCTVLDLLMAFHEARKGKIPPNELLKVLCGLKRSKA